MPLSPSRVQSRATPNVTDARPKAGRPDSTDAQQPPPQEGQLGFPRPAIPDHRAGGVQGPAPLSVAVKPESKTSTEERAALTAAPGRPTGPLTIAIERLKPDSVNQEHYVLFRNGQLALSKSKPPGIGLAKREQHKALCDLIAAELLQTSSERAVGHREGEASDAGARTLAKAIVDRMLKQFGNHVQLNRLMAILPGLPTLFELSASGLDTVTATIKNAPRASTQADAHEVPSAAKAQASHASSVPPATKALYAFLCGVLVQFGLLKSVGNRETAFTARDMDDVIARATHEEAGFRFRQTVARMFDAIHGDAALSERTIAHANRLREALAMEVSHSERVAGAGPAAATLLLSLPPERLKRMFLTPDQVYRLAEEAVVVLGHMSQTMSVIKQDDIGEDFFEKLPSPQQAASMMYHLADRFMASAGGKLIASRFGTAIQILLHNAQRLEAFAELDDAPDEQLELESASIFLLLQEHVPADFDNAPRIDLQPQTETSTPLLTLADEPPVMLHVAPAEPQAETKTSPHEPLATSRLNVPRNGFPGAKRRNPAQHFHPKDHRALAGDQLKRRQEVLKARELNLIGGYDKWTPELRSLLKDRSRARRMAQRGTTDISSGGRLVQPWELDG